jgi:hypothetical protein
MQNNETLSLDALFVDYSLPTGASGSTTPVTANTSAIAVVPIGTWFEQITPMDIGGPRFPLYIDSSYEYVYAPAWYQAGRGAFTRLLLDGSGVTTEALDVVTAANLTSTNASWNMTFASLTTLARGSSSPAMLVAAEEATTGTVLYFTMAVTPTASSRYARASATAVEQLASTSSASLAAAVATSLLGIVGGGGAASATVIQGAVSVVARTCDQDPEAQAEAEERRVAFLPTTIGSDPLLGAWGFLVAVLAGAAVVQAAVTGLAFLHLCRKDRKLRDAAGADADTEGSKASGSAPAAAVAGAPIEERQAEASGPDAESSEDATLRAAALWRLAQARAKCPSLWVCVLNACLHGLVYQSVRILFQRPSAGHVACAILTLVAVAIVLYATCRVAFGALVSPAAGGAMMWLPFDGKFGYALPAWLRYSVGPAGTWTTALEPAFASIPDDATEASAASPGAGEVATSLPPAKDTARRIKVLDVTVSASAATRGGFGSAVALLFSPMSLPSGVVATSMGPLGFDAYDWAFGAARKSCAAWLAPLMILRTVAIATLTVPELTSQYGVSVCEGVTYSIAAVVSVFILPFLFARPYRRMMENAAVLITSAATVVLAVLVLYPQHAEVSAGLLMLSTIMSFASAATGLVLAFVEGRWTRECVAQIVESTTDTKKAMHTKGNGAVNTAQPQKLADCVTVVVAPKGTLVDECDDASNPLARENSHADGGAAADDGSHNAFTMLE